MKATYITLMSASVVQVLTAFYFDHLALCLALMVGTLLGNGFALAYMVSHDES